MSEGQGKSSIAPLFQGGAITKLMSQTDIEVRFLDLNVSVSNDIVTIKV